MGKRTVVFWILYNLTADWSNVRTGVMLGSDGLGNTLFFF